MKTKKTLTALSLTAITAISAQTASAELLWSDNFNTADGPLDASSTAGRIGGSLAGEAPALESFIVGQNISGNRLQLVGEAPTGAGIGDGGARWGGDGSRFNWATSSKAGQITSDGGLIVSYDWDITSGTNGDWVALAFGVTSANSPNVVVEAPETDYGVLHRNALDGGTISQYFDNGGFIGSHNGSLFTPTADTTHKVVHTLLFDSFAAGTNVQATLTIDGIEIGSNVFQWDNTDDLRIDIVTFRSDTHFIDNLEISTLPEPGSLALIAVGGLAVLRRRRA